MNYALKDYSTGIFFSDYDEESLEAAEGAIGADLYLIFEISDHGLMRRLLQRILQNHPERNGMPFVIVVRKENHFNGFQASDYKEHIMAGKLIVMANDGLVEGLQTFIEHTYLSRPVRMDSRSRRKEDFPILVVDDSTVSRTSIAESLRRKGYKIYEAEDGVAALELFHEKNPKLIITDIVMERMNGIDLCERVKEINKYTEIIFTSGMNHQDTIDTAYQTGAGDYLIKPVNIDRLTTKVEARIENLIEKSKYKALLVDDDRVILEKLKLEFTKSSMNIITATNGVEGLAKAVTELPSVIITDVEMPYMNGYEFLEAIRSMKQLEECTKIMVSGAFSEKKMKARMNDATIHFFPKPFDIDSLISSAETAILTKKVFFKRENELLISSIKALITALEERDGYTRGHSDRVTAYALAMGKVMELNDYQLRVLELSASLHDIGKIGIRDDVLIKPEKLTDEEYSIIKSHAASGAKILEPIESLKWVSNIVMHHHERVDGKGYPDALTDEEIPTESKIIAVADTYDAMTTARPYRKNPLSPEDAIEKIKTAAGTQLDIHCVEALIEVLGINRIH